MAVNEERFHNMSIDSICINFNNFLQKSFQISGLSKTNKKKEFKNEQEVILSTGKHFQEKPFLLIEAKRMVSISSGLDLDAARSSSLLGSPERTKSKDMP